MSNLSFIFIWLKRGGYILEKIDNNVDKTIMEKILLDLLNDKEISLDLSNNKEIDKLFDNKCDGSNKLEIILSKDIDHNYILRSKTRDQEGHRLLDDLWKDIGCMYLSDLKNKEFSLMIKLYLNKVRINKYSLDDWNDTINYLTDKDINFTSFDEVRRFILDWKG